MSAKFELERFSGACLEAARAPDGARRVLELMRTAVSDADGIKRAVAPNEPGKTMLDAPLFRSPELLVLNAALLPNLRSPAHDHRMWAVIGIYEGQENNVFYRRTGAGIEEVNRREVRAGEAILLAPGVIHAIANPRGSQTLGLHVYGGDLVSAKRSMWRPGSGEELAYDAPQFFAWCAELGGSSHAA